MRRAAACGCAERRTPAHKPILTRSRIASCAEKVRRCFPDVCHCVTSRKTRAALLLCLRYSAPWYWYQRYTGAASRRWAERDTDHLNYRRKRRRGDAPTRCYTWVVTAFRFSNFHVFHETFSDFCWHFQQVNIHCFFSLTQYIYLKKLEMGVSLWCIISPGFFLLWVLFFLSFLFIFSESLLISLFLFFKGF